MREFIKNGVEMVEYSQAPGFYLGKSTKRICTKEEWIRVKEAMQAIEDSRKLAFNPYGAYPDKLPDEK